MNSGNAPYVLLVVDIPLPTSDISEHNLKLFLSDCASTAAKCEATKEFSKNVWMLPVSSALQSLNAIVSLCQKLGYTYTTYLVKEEITPINY